jgi:hypothetical protein
MEAQVLPIGNGWYAAQINGVTWYVAEFATSCMIWCWRMGVPFEPWVMP